MAADFRLRTGLVVDGILCCVDVWLRGKCSCLVWGCGEGQGLANVITTTTTTTTNTTVFCCPDTVVAVVWPDDVFSSACRIREKIISFLSVT